MSGKDWFDDFMDYKLSTSPVENEPTSSGCLPFVITTAIVLLLISKLFA